MFRGQLPRIYELRGLLPKPTPVGAYFQSLDESLAKTPQKMKQYRDLEAVLQVLDDSAWSTLKAEVKPLLTAKHPLRGWQPLFDKLNEANAYAHLARVGCTGIRFIPRSKTKGRRTPDLEASERDRRVLCEVKTINRSEGAVHRFANNDVFDVSDHLPTEFFEKLERVLNEALDQMSAYCSQADTWRIAYVIVNYDDRLHEYEDRYRVQLGDFLSQRKPPSLDVAFDIKPPFHIAQA